MTHKKESYPIVGLTGTLGAGKGTVARFFKDKGFDYTSCSDYLRKELKKKGIPENIDNLKALGDALRKQHGPGYIAEELLKTISKKTIVDSLRNPGEVQALQTHDWFILLAVDAPLQIRYERISERQRAGDNVSFETFCAQEKRQLSGSANQTQINTCIEMADIIVYNDSDIASLTCKLNTIYAKIMDTA